MSFIFCGFYGPKRGASKDKFIIRPIVMLVVGINSREHPPLMNYGGQDGIGADTIRW
jgi:hypothetical protein